MSDDVEKALLVLKGCTLGRNSNNRENGQLLKLETQAYDVGVYPDSAKERAMLRPSETCRGIPLQGPAKCASIYLNEAQDFSLPRVVEIGRRLVAEENALMKEAERQT